VLGAVLGEGLKKGLGEGGEALVRGRFRAALGLAGAQRVEHLAEVVGEDGVEVVLRVELADVAELFGVEGGGHGRSQGGVRGGDKDGGEADVGLAVGGEGFADPGLALVAEGLDVLALLGEP
jgi:hypothetical protein